MLDDQQVACLDEGTEGMGYRDFFAPRRLADAMSSCLTSEQMTALAAAG